ncbi:5-methyltetrahydropteroyltriglutamate--homocysteine S-methyltransferase [Alteribacillus sp. HJP-4]|uniref:5-methyltetrahydropteroyltriglutamate-- homocysteine S-methyltransferase n=1 Tax=Alteribacillus sp. HJP-4 TaxID=2775394 RepID=UPI0035CD191D
MERLKSSNLGYPRLGEKREWKKALEGFWAGRLEEEELQKEMKQLRLSFLKKQKEKGIDMIPVGDFSYYDHILDTAVMFGLVPERFGVHKEGSISLDTYFAMARGTKDAPACEMTKWFNTNYHYIVPEIGRVEPRLTENYPLQAYKEAKNELGIEGKPVLIGPLTFLKLSKGFAPEEFEVHLEKLLPLYEQVLKELEEAGAEWVQIDEPVLSVSITEKDISMVKAAYQRLNDAAPQLSLFLQTYFEAAARFDEITRLPVAGIGLDFVHGAEQNIKALQECGFPEDKVLGAGIVDGRNIWRSDLKQKRALLTLISNIVPPERTVVQPSCSLLHVPVTTELETELPAILKDALAFADEKLTEITILRDLDHNTEAIEKNTNDLQALAQSDERGRASNSELSGLRSRRPLPFQERRVLQEQKWKLPALPTTTIGSFPQTKEVRVQRQKFRKGELPEQEYRTFIEEKMKEWVAIQEEIGLDVLVHGEFERNDMVEFFGQKLKGFAFTAFGWVQSYGSRCVKPPVIYGDVAFDKPMTVEETRFAQSLTDKPVKGMLTGPVTILNWSFVRDDLPAKDVCNQIAAAISTEVKALEDAGIEMIQVDEPALREGLPLKKEDWQDYLDWAVHAFRLATSQVKDTTQIHTHMCYSEFQDMIESIRALDADVISIETSRSHGELIEAFETAVYDKGIGLGVYDIHSPRVPPVGEMKEMIERALQVLPSSLFWINPDCGLKTRKDPETIEALKNMVTAAKEIRETKVPVQQT